MRALSLGLLLAAVASLSLQAGPRDGRWGKVDAAIQQGLPRTAITNLEPILQAALRAKAYPEAVKALGLKLALQGGVEGGKPEEKILRLEAEIPTMPREMAPVLETLLAHWYWAYFRENQWRFMERTATAQTPGKDFTTWDLPRLFGQIDRQFQKALAAEKTLKATPIGAWDDLLSRGSQPDAARPTLYDFIVHEALEFYTAGEQVGARGEDAFELQADAPALDSAEKFLAWEIPALPTGASSKGAAGVVFEPALKALRLYQELLRFHANDPVPRPAFAAADLERLHWAGNVAVGEDKDARYRAALEAFIERHGALEISALAGEREGRLLQRQGDLAGAHQLAQRGASAFPQSPGGKLCRNLLHEIETREVAIRTEQVWNCGAGLGNPSGTSYHPACPMIEVSYRNIEKIHFRAVAYDWEFLFDEFHFSLWTLNNEAKHAILSTTPAQEWSEALPATRDFKERTVSLPASGKLKPGFYIIVASPEADFRESDNIVSMAQVWVSNLALITRATEGRTEGFLLDAESGEPIPGAEIDVWRLDVLSGRVTEPGIKTDENGFFSVPSVFRGCLLRARHAGQELLAVGQPGFEPAPTGGPQTSTILFTDRALYRPGQTIQYKGICMRRDPEKDDYQVLSGEDVTVVLRDANDKEFARQKHRANDFGSFAGSFTAPRQGLLGELGLAVEGRAVGGAVVQVEEYKRPKFEVTLDAPKAGAKLGQTAVLTGHAVTYAGAGVDGASVEYCVTRLARLPPWWERWHPGAPESQSRQIAHGSLKTGPDGSFKIEFTALPDLAVAEKDQPVFDFEINADVTDTAGETRSAQRELRAGYTALEVSFEAADWQTEAQPVQFKLHAQTLAQEPQAIEASVKVYSLQPPDRVQRPPLSRNAPRHYGQMYSGSPGQSDATTNDLSDLVNWPLGAVVAESSVSTGTNGSGTVSFKLPVGAYAAALETRDRFGKPVTARLPLQVLNPEAPALGIKIPHLLAAPDWAPEPGREFTALWGTGYETGRAFIEIEHRGWMLQRFWTQPGRTQQQIRLAVTEAMRGGFTLHVTRVRENRAWLESRKVEVPWSNKDLDIRWEHFVSKLAPGQKETWTMVVGKGEGKSEVRSPKSEVQGEGEAVSKSKEISPHAQPPPSALHSVAELVATLYDESLDAFVPHEWPEKIEGFREETSRLQFDFANYPTGFGHVLGSWSNRFEPVSFSYRSFPPGFKGDYAMRALDFGIHAGAVPGAEEAAGPTQGGPGPMNIRSKGGSPAPSVASAPAPPSAPVAPTAPIVLDRSAAGGGEPNLAGPPLKAFFFPRLTSDSNGVVRLTFTMPEALTRWHFMAFAHDRSLRSGFLEDHVTTAKALMVQPNPPRFLREGDTVEFTVKVSNQSDDSQTGSVALHFSDALTEASADAALRLSAAPSDEARAGSAGIEQAFSIPAKESRAFSWRLTVPDGCGFLIYKAVAAAARVSDGEEGAVPVLSRRVLITESLPLPVRGPATNQFAFAKLLNSGASKTLRHESLTVQMVSHPAWYAVLALPYLMEYPHECGEQTFNRLYANALARHIANCNPKIRRVFDLWKDTPAADSPLEKNQDLKAVSLEETPWLRQAESEAQARRNVGILFDTNRMDYEIRALTEKLAEMRLEDGSWPWFPGGRRSDYITLYITAGLGRLRHLGVELESDPALDSLERLDTWMAEAYERIQRGLRPEQYVPSPADALYLYGRGFFLKDQPLDDKQRKAVEFFLAQARKCWLQTDGRQTQGQLALALHRFAAFNSANETTARQILASLKERSVHSEEMGMFWRDTESSWWWYRAPIETQALMIEAFDEILNDQASVEECRVWLLKQKQTRDWTTTKATADAAYALLLRGADLLDSDALVEVEMGGKKLEKSEVAKSEVRRTESEAGAGFYEVRFDRGRIEPRLGNITVRKTDSGVAWGSVHWQYLEDIGKVTPYAGTPLKLRKTLYVKTNTSHGPELQAVAGPVRVGDELVTRIELRVDRDMEFVHLKDQRGSGAEPINVLSGYQYQDGLAYYESTRDTASHFFIDYLPKGVYVFEYSARVQLRGRFQSGVASIQCLYAPAFNSHSESVEIVCR